MKLADYLNKFHGALNAQDSQTVVDMLSLTDMHLQFVKSWGFVIYDHVSQVAANDPRFDADMRLVIVSHIRAILAVCREQANDAYHYQTETIKAFTVVFQKTPHDWLLPALSKLTIDLRTNAERIDRDLTTQRKKPQKMNEAVNLLRNGYGTLGKYNKGCMLGIIVQLLRMYFSTNNLQGCKPLIRSVYSSNFPPIESFPMSQQVTFKYFEGRLKLNDLEFQEANEKLSFALRNCVGSDQNKRFILLYIIPVRLVLGCPAKISTLERYDLKQYIEVIAAVKTGNFQMLEHALRKHEVFFLRHSIYYCLKSQLKFIMYRNLFKQTWAIKEPPTNEQRHLDISDLGVACQVAGLKLDKGEIECIVANLIYKKKLKAYIAHQHRKIVMGKHPMVPFPPLTFNTN